MFRYQGQKRLPIKNKMADQRIYHINRTVFFNQLLDQKGWREGKPGEKGTFGMWFPHNSEIRESTVQLYPKCEPDILDDKKLCYQHLRDRKLLDNIPKTYLTVDEVLAEEHISSEYLWFLKHRTSTEGKHVWIYRRREDLLKYFGDSNITEHYIVQREVEDSFLVFGHKFVLRVFVLIHNKKLYIYKEFIGKMQSKPYSNTGEERDIHIHSIPVPDSKTQVMAIRGTLWAEYEKVYPSIKKVCGQVIRAFFDVLNDNGNQYSLLGIDLVMDREYKPWIIEINSHPSLWSDTGQASTFIKKEIVKDLYGLLIKPVLGLSPSVGKFEEIGKMRFQNENQ